MRTLSPEWVTGFVDGEGCFVLGVYTRARKGKAITTTTPTFSISQRQDNNAVLFDIRDYFGVGVVEARSASPTSGSPMSQYSVRRESDFGVVLAHFDSYPLLGKKRNDYAIWKIGMEIIISTMNRPRFHSGVPHGLLRYTESEIRQLKQLHEELQASRKFAT